MIALQSAFSVAAFFQPVSRTEQRLHRLPGCSIATRDPGAAFCSPLSLPAGATVTAFPGDGFCADVFVQELPQHGQRGCRGGFLMHQKDPYLPGISPLATVGPVAALASEVLFPTRIIE